MVLWRRGEKASRRISFKRLRPSQNILSLTKTRAGRICPPTSNKYFCMALTPRKSNSGMMKGAVFIRLRVLLKVSFRIWNAVIVKRIVRGSVKSLNVIRIIDRAVHVMGSDCVPRHWPLRLPVCMWVKLSRCPSGRLWRGLRMLWKRSLRNDRKLRASSLRKSESVWAS